MRWKDEGGLGRACGLGSAWAYVASRMSEGWGGRGGSGGPGEAALASRSWSMDVCFTFVLRRREDECPNLEP